MFGRKRRRLEAQHAAWEKRIHEIYAQERAECFRDLTLRVERRVQAELGISMTCTIAYEPPVISPVSFNGVHK